MNTRTPDTRRDSPDLLIRLRQAFDDLAGNFHAFIQRRDRRHRFEVHLTAAQREEIFDRAPGTPGLETTFATRDAVFSTYLEGMRSSELPPRAGSPGESRR